MSHAWLRSQVRPEHAADADAIRRVHDAAFGGPVEGRIVDEIRGSEWWIAGGSLVAEDDGVIGHVLLSRGDLVDERGVPTPIGVIGPVGVLPERQGQGIGAELTRAAVLVARRHELPLIVLLGHASYYPRFGFEPARAIGVQPPRPWPEESWLALRLPGWTPGLRGVVRFPPAFPLD